MAADDGEPYEDILKIGGHFIQNTRTDKGRADAAASMRKKFVCDFERPVADAKGSQVHDVVSCFCDFAKLLDNEFQLNNFRSFEPSRVDKTR